VADFRKLGNEPSDSINPLNAKLKPICHLLALLGAHNILRVGRIRVKYVECFSLFGLVLAALHGPLFVNPCLKERLSAEHWIKLF